jgi:flagellin-like protein
MKITRSRKALSPVIATIILIAVTVAVSIAVAAWMGALTFSFMSGGEQVQLGSPYGWVNGGSTAYLRVSCPGGNAITVVAVRINGVPATLTSWSWDNSTAGTPATFPIGPIPPVRAVVLYLTYNNATGVGQWQSSYSYTFTVTSGKNNEYTTTGTCP